MEPKQQQIPEAIASVTYSVISPNGYPLLFTVRDESGARLLEKMKMIEQQFAFEGYKPQEKQKFGGGYPKKEPIYVEGKLCPTCGSKLVKGETKTGKKYIKCSTQKYDFSLGQVQGCPYTIWGDVGVDPQI